MVRDSCSDGIRLSVTKSIGTIPDCSYFPIPTCTHEDSPFHPLSLRPQLMASSHLQGMVLVSVPGPGLSPDILYRCSCIRSGGETFLRPKGPAAVLPLSHVADFLLYLFFEPIYIYGMIFPHREIS